jgi:hypothetical protein
MLSTKRSAGLKPVKADRPLSSDKEMAAHLGGFFFSATD